MFGNILGLESAIKHWLEPVASTSLNNPNRPSILNSLGTSYKLRFERFGEKDIDLLEFLPLHLTTLTEQDTSIREVNDIDSAIN